MSEKTVLCVSELRIRHDRPASSFVDWTAIDTERYDGLVHPEMEIGRGAPELTPLQHSSS